MAASPIQYKCRKADCKVAQTGSCAEGHTPLASCPNYGGLSADILDAGNGELDDSQGKTVPETARVNLPSGDALTSDEVEQFLRWRPATFVAVIGDSFSGKTTLICAIYDRFLKGDFAGLAFAGSRSLLALERRSHYARVDSGRDTPETARTSHLDGLRYFHFAVAPNGNPTKRVDLLLSDRSGEVYRSARNNSAVVSSLLEIPQADRVVLLLDGGRIADPIQRSGAIQSVRQSLRVLLDNSALDATSIVQVVTTKFDLLDTNHDTDLAASLAGFRLQLTSDFGPRVKSISYHDIAARDPAGAFVPAYGLDALIKDWTTSHPRYAPPSFPSLSLHCEFDRLLERTPKEGLA